MNNSDCVSVVILCWNRKEDVKESLKRLKKQTYHNVEVIVVDNASTDGTVLMLENEFPEVVLIKMPKNMGIEAYNIGFKNAKGKYVVILDDDSFPAEDAIKLMVEKFEKDDKLGIAAFDVRNYFNYDETNKPVEKNNQNFANTSAAVSDYLMSFNGAGAGVRRDLLEKVEFYPEEFFLYWNEMDLAFKILNEGYKIEFFSDLIAYHKYSPVNRSSWRAPFYYTRNLFWLIWKNYPNDILFKATVKVIRMVFYYSFEQKTFIYIKAFFAALADIKLIKNKRKPVKRYIAEGLRIPLETPFMFYR